jgi:hypothetical protein
MNIQTAVDFQKVSDQLRRDLRSIGYNPDLNKMFLNIEKMVSELSKIEVLARRNLKSNMTLDKVNEINKAIDHLEKLILMAKIMS